MLMLMLMLLLLINCPLFVVSAVRCCCVAVSLLLLPFLLTKLLSFIVRHNSLFLVFFDVFDVILLFLEVAFSLPLPLLPF